MEKLDWGVPNDVWIRAVSKAEYVAPTEDYSTMRKAYQSKLVMNIVKGRRHSEKGELVVQKRAKLLRFVKKNYGPFIATITRSGVNGRRPRDRNWGQEYS